MFFKSFCLFAFAFAIESNDGFLRYPGRSEECVCEINGVDYEFVRLFW